MECRLVNDSSVNVATLLVDSASYQRQRTGLTLVQNITRSVWVDITVPPDTPAGTEHAAYTTLAIHLQVQSI
jgi:hypothetical protein